jgi:hypothetical protein
MRKRESLVDRKRDLLDVEYITSHDLVEKPIV